MRRRKFYESKKLIDTINANPKNTFRLELNHMADLFDCEYDKLTTFKDSSVQSQVELIKVPPYNFSDGLPKKINWKQYLNTTVGDQTRPICGGSWAFSAIGAIEGANALMSGQSLPLSEQ